MDDTDLNGAMTCARYAFAPNFYHYCGPDTSGEFGEYIKEETADGGLVQHLTDFEVMYPYLKAIAEANGVKDPLDPRVVEAYWVGNKMLEKVREQDVYNALTEKQNLVKRISKDEMKWLLPKIDKNAKLHHSFHVFNVFTRTGHHTVEHTVETMDQCRISWGKIQDIWSKTQDLRIHITGQKLTYHDGLLRLMPSTNEVKLPAAEYLEKLKPGDWVSVHWGFVCDVLTKPQVDRLERYTIHHLELANLSL